MAFEALRAATDDLIPGTNDTVSAENIVPGTNDNATGGSGEDAINGTGTSVEDVITETEPSVGDVIPGTGYDTTLTGESHGQLQGLYPYVNFEKKKSVVTEPIRK